MIENAIEAHKVLPDFHNEITFLIKTDPIIKADMEKFIQTATKKTEATLKNYKDRIRVKNIRIAAVLINRTIEDFIHFIIYNNSKEDKKILTEEFIDMLCQYLSKE